MNTQENKLFKLVGITGFCVLLFAVTAFGGSPNVGCGGTEHTNSITLGLDVPAFRSCK